MTAPALNKLMSARMEVAKAAALRRVEGATEREQGAVVRAEMLALADLCLEAVAQYDLECERRGHG